MRILILALLLIPNLTFAETMMDVRTGYGFIVDSDGRIICRYILPKGLHPLKEGYRYIEVISQKELDKIEVYKEPKKILTPEEKLNKLGLTKKELKELLK